jgi:hypothetical protein
MKLEVFPESVKGLFIPKEYQENFYLEAVKEERKEWRVICREKAEKVPRKLSRKGYKQNGYVGKTEVINFPLGGKPAYLHFYRRKWKDLETGEIVSNSYQLHPEGMKATKDFGDFLKGLTRWERCKFYFNYPNLRLGRE